MTDFETDYCILPPDSEFVAADVAIKNVVEKHKIPIKLTGSSGDRGWSAWSTLERCPYLYFLKYIRGGIDLEQRSSGPRDVGSLIHAFLAVYYRRFKKYPVEKFIAALENEGVNPREFMEARQVFDAYRVHYDRDIFEPLAVEHTAMDPKTKNTCRYDAIVRITHPPVGIQKGIWICEHKSYKNFSADTLEGWSLDGEILGELAFWKLAGLDKKFGPLQGVMLNILGKQKIPKFHRTYVSPVSVRTDAHLRNLAWLEAFRKRCVKTGEWPQFFNACIGRFGRCDGYDHCLNKGME